MIPTAPAVVLPAALPDDMTLLEAAQLATARHLHLVFDHHDQQQKLTPVVMPWHTRYGVLDKSLLEESA